jgi:hypothetical protein
MKGLKERIDLDGATDFFSGVFHSLIGICVFQALSPESN